MGLVKYSKQTMVEQTLAPVNLTGSGDTTETAHVDSLGWSRAVHHALIGNSADTLAVGLYISVVLQHSDTEVDGDFAAVTSDDLIEGTFLDATTGQIALINAPAEDQVTVEVVYKTQDSNGKRYTRLSFVRVGNHASGTPCAALGEKYFAESSNADGYT